MWRQDDNGVSAYMSAEHPDSYVPFVPDPPPGKYRAAVIVTDPGNLAEPLYFNEVGFDFPFPKRPPYASSKINQGHSDRADLPQPRP